MAVGMASQHAMVTQLLSVMVGRVRFVFRRSTCHLFRLMEMVIKGRLTDRLPQRTRVSCAQKYCRTPNYISS